MYVCQVTWCTYSLNSTVCPLYFSKSENVLNLNILTIPCAGKDVKQLKLSYAAGGNVRYRHFGKRLQLLMKLNLLLGT